ncbi:MAG: RNA polymerase sigma factor [Candidatus Saccharibacteria bacterium]|nr:RNA polymerase sigma factor [Candidatus Saccharibacteria bacterium]
MSEAYNYGDVELTPEEEYQARVSKLVDAVQADLKLADDESSVYHIAAQRKFEDIVRLTSGHAYSTARRFTHDAEGASEVVQESYLRAWRGLPGFRGESSFTTWFHRITVNAANTYIEKRKKLQDKLAINRDEDETKEYVAKHSDYDVEHRVENAELRDELRSAIEQLSPIMRSVVVLRDVYDLPHDVIAQKLGISETASKVRLHRARRRLRELVFPDKESTIEEV